MLLRPIELGRLECLGVKSLVDIAVKGKQRLPGVGGAEPGAPGLIARDVEAGEFVRQVHQLRNLLRRALAQQIDQFAGLLHKAGQAVRQGPDRGVVVQ